MNKPTTADIKELKYREFHKKFAKFQVLFKSNGNSLYSLNNELLNTALKSGTNLRCFKHTHSIAFFGMFVFKGLSCFNTILSYANTALKFLHSKNFIYALQEAIKAKNKTVWQYRIIP